LGFQQSNISSLSVEQARATAAKPMCIHVNRQERFQRSPELDAKADRGRVV
jgi:hypothetical protein